MATTRARRTEKAQVSIPAPSRFTGPANISVFGLTPNGDTLTIDRSRKGRYDTYYQMFKQHPTLRAGVEKIAKTTVSNGYRFVPETQGETIDKTKLKSLNIFFRLSNASQLLRLAYKDLLIYGEGFWLIQKTRGSKPIKAMRLHPKYMDEKVEAGQLTGWRYGPVMASDKAIEYASTDVLHFKFDDPDNDIRGLSLLASLELTVASDLFAMKYNEAFFENSAHTGIIFNMKNSTIDEVKRNREWLEQNYVGAERAHRPILLEGDIDVQKSVSTRAEMEFIEGRKFNRQEILSVLDIDPTKLGISESANRSISKEADNTFRQENVAPLQLVVEEEINNHLILQLFAWDDVIFRQNDSSLRDLVSNMDLYTSAEKYGVYSINDIRAELGLPPITGGGVHFIQTAAGAIPVEWLDDVAKRLIPAAGAELGAMGGVGTSAEVPSGTTNEPTDGAIPPGDGQGN